MIEEIKNRIRIIDLANSYGMKPDKNGFIKSIYKEEKTPSLKIYEKTNTFYDFSTQRGGDVINFYADLKRISVRDAINELSQASGISTMKKNINKVKKLLKEILWNTLNLPRANRKVLTNG